MKYLIILVALLMPSTALGGRAVLYEIDGKAFEGYYASPGENAPFLLLLHDWDGLTGYELKRAEMLAEQGYAVFAADLFGAGVRPTEMVDKRQHTGELYKDRDKMRLLMNGALEAAKRQGAKVENAVAFGYCFGGAAVLELARSGSALKGYATFHGGLQTPEGQDYSKTTGSILVMHGTADSVVTMEHFAALADELEQQGVRHEMTTYSGAPHGFTLFGTDRYREEADSASWNRFLDWLKVTLKK